MFGVTMITSTRANFFHNFFAFFTAGPSLAPLLPRGSGPSLRSQILLGLASFARLVDLVLEGGSFLFLLLLVLADGVLLAVPLQPFLQLATAVFPNHML